MNRFLDIVGQEHIKEYLQGAVVNDTVSHAYIINGEKSSGKMMLAKTFALAMMCERGGKEPCLECEECKKVISGRHPDIIYFAKDKSKKTDIIDVGGIREQVVNSVYNKPIDARKKIYIIDDADRMNTKSQNALLKTLEEPPSYAVIILLTRNCERLLPTILSRCIILNMRPVEDRIIKQYLKDNIKILDSQADIAVKMSGGNVGKARLLAEGSEFFKFNNDMIDVLKRLPESNLKEILEFVEKVLSYTKAQEKGEKAPFSIDDLFELFVLWYRDVLLYKSVEDTESLTFKDEAGTIVKQAGYYTYEALNNVIKELDEAKSRITSNVNLDTVIELLFIKIMEMSKW